MRRRDDTRTPTAFANGIDRGRSGAFLHDAPRALLHHSPDSCVHLRTCFLPLSLSRLLTTVGFPRAAADQSASLLSTPARFTATRVTAHNLETPSWSASLSRGPATLSVRDELWSHMPHAIPLILALRALAAACGPMLPNARMQPNTSLLLYFFSLVRRMIATLINCVAEKTNAHSGLVFSVAFSPDGTKIVSGSRDQTIKVWDFGAQEPSNRPSLAKTNACWLVWQANWSY